MSGQSNNIAFQHFFSVMLQSNSLPTFFTRFTVASEIGIKFCITGLLRHLFRKYIARHHGFALLCFRLFLAKFESLYFKIIKDSNLNYINLFRPLVLGLFSFATSGLGAYKKGVGVGGLIET